MLLGLPAHQAHGPLVVLAEEPQGLPVAVAQAAGLGSAVPLPAPRPVRQPGQGPVGPQPGGGPRLPALGAGEAAAALFRAVAQAAATEVVAALYGHRILEILQTDGADELLLQVLRSHGGASPPQRPRRAAASEPGSWQPHFRDRGLGPVLTRPEAARPCLGVGGQLWSRGLSMRRYPGLDTWRDQTWAVPPVDSRDVDRLTDGKQDDS